jgi:hypothetical protein
MIMRIARKRRQRKAVDSDDDLPLQECLVCGFAFVGIGETCQRRDCDEERENEAALAQAMREMNRGGNDFNWDQDDVENDEPVFYDE